MTVRPSIAWFICLLAGCQTVDRVLLGGDSGMLDENNTLSVAESPREANNIVVDDVPSEHAPSDVSAPAQYDVVRVTAALPLAPTALAAPPETIAPPLSDVAVAPGPSLVRLEQMALANNPAVARSAAQVEALRGKWVQVGLPPNVQLGYFGEDMGLEGTAGKQGGFVSQQFIMGGKLGLNRAVVDREIARAEQQWSEEKQRVLTDVRVGYFAVLLVQKRLDLVQDLVRVSDEAVKASRDLLEAKEISRVALLQTEVVAQNTRILLRKTENESAATWRRLLAVVGMPNLQPWRIDGAVEPPASALDWQTSLARLLAESPELAAAVMELERAESQLDRALVEATPDVNAQVGVQHEEITGDTVTQVQVGIPIPILNRNQGGIRQAEAQIVAAQRNLERVRLDLEKRLATVFQQHADARFAVAEFSERILPKAQETFDLVTAGYSQGEVDYLALLAAQRTYFQTNLSYMDALGELWTARQQIDGLLLDGSLQEGHGQ